MSTIDLIEKLNRRLDERESVVRALQMRYAGDAPLSYLSPESKAALGNRLQRLSVPYGRLAVDALAERLRLVGVESSSQPDAALWQAFLRSGGVEVASHAHRDFLALGQSGVSVWVDRTGAPRWAAESPLQVAYERDAQTGEIAYAVKRWRDGSRVRLVLWEPSSIGHYVSASHVPDGGVVPSTGWEFSHRLPNPFGRVPFVPMVNRLRLDDVDGTSEMEPIADLCDAPEKCLLDSMVTSEFYARPRRWATGVEILEDENGKPVDPFANSDRTWLSEDAETKFGQFPNADPNFYRSQVDILLGSIGAISGLPPSAMGQHGDNPTSAEALYASNLTLTSKAEQRIRTLAPAWAEAFALGRALLSNGPVQPEAVLAVWADPQNSSEAQEADAAQKLYASGLISRKAALRRLGYSPDEIAEIEADVMRETIIRQVGAKP